MAEKCIKKARKGRLRGAKSERSLQKNYKESGSNAQAINHEYEVLIKWFQTVKFQKVWFGGIDESNLWKKLEELNKLYEAALSAERARYDALILEHTKSCNTRIHRYKQEFLKKAESGQGL